MSNFDAGLRAARAGKPRSGNPHNHPDRQRPGSAHERKASEWDEGYDSYHPEQEAAQRQERARKAAQARWRA